MKINEFFYRLQGRDDFVTRNHTHDEIELIECIRGSGTVLKADRFYPLQDRFLYIIDARRPHIVYPDDCEAYLRNKIVIDADSFHSLLRETGLSQSAARLLDSPPVSTAAHPEIDRLFETVASLCQSGLEESMGFAHGYILQLLHFIFSHSRAAALPIPQDGFIGQALSIIAEADSATSLHEISERLNLNKYYLCHLFREKTGITLSEYISEKKYEKSLRLLRDTNESIESIASLCGFSSASSFTRFFKQKNGAPPSACRKKSAD